MTWKRTIVLLLLCSGCSRPPSPPTLPGISTQLFEWSLDDGTRKGRPGLDDGWIQCVFADKRLAITLWTDVRSGVGGSSGRGKGHGEGHVGWNKDLVSWECSLTSPTQGAVTIKGQLFQLKDGNFFLASSREGSRVVQLRRDVGEWTREAAIKAAGSDPEITRFFQP